LEAGGSFTPVSQMVPRSPTYLFLIEKESTHDHVAGILDRAVDRLVDEKVAIERYHFRGDPRWLVGGETGRQLEPIADVAARYGDHRLVVLGAGDGMFEPLSDRLDAGVEQALTQWAPRAVLSTKPLETWSWRELSLVDQGGFDLATASHSGLRALAGRAAAESDRPAEMLEGVVVSMPARPSLGSREPQGAVSASDAGRRTVRVFISSPADVRAERLIAERVVQRLDEEFALHLELRAVMWEREPLLASHHVQGLITPPHDTDIVVVILWTRLGPALPADKFAGPLSDGEVSGTEWEFEDALKSYRERGAPEILVYRKTVEPTFAVGDTNAARERLGQKERLDAFLRKWFADPDSANPTAASSSFADAAQFEQMLEDHLRALVRRRARSEVPRQARKSALLICVGRELGGEADVERFAALLRDSAGFAVEVLRNPNRTTLTDALESLLRQNSDPDAIILIHFKGRYAPGGEGALFVGSDIIPASNFAGIVNRSAAGHQLIIIDDFSHFQIEGDPVVGGLSEATSSLPRYTREAISSLATRETDRHLTGLLIEAFEHNLDRITAPDFTFRDLFELVRRRDALIDSGSVVSHPLNELNIRYFSNGSTSTVIGAAHPRATQTPLPPSLIFISYAREDQAAAGRLCDFLEESGLDVWLDSRQLSAGEDWSEESRRQIDNCSLFVPLISTNSLRRQDGLFHREWMQATERARGLDPSRPFIIPVAIDDTPADTEDIPEEFRSVQWTWLPGGAGDEAFLQRVVGLMSRTPADDGGKMSVVMKSVKKSKRPFMSSVADWLDQLTPWETRDVRIYITSPRSSRDDLQDKQSYGDMFSYKVEGRLRRLPEGHEIWLLNVNERSKEIWPQGFAPVTDWDAQTGEWTGRVCGRPVETIKIVAVVAPPTSADFFHYYQELCDQGTVKPLKRIPPECINRASVQATLR